MVEEVSLQGTVSRITERPTFQDSEDKRTLWVQMVKANIAHFDAVKELAHQFNLTPEAIGYSGIKDTVAITCQEMSIRGIEREDADLFQHNRILLRPLRHGNGATQPGQLQGNRFTLTVRTHEECDTEEITARLNKPFTNFFGPQRFGTRVLAHRLGRALLKGDIQSCLRLFFTEPGVHDIPYYRDLREQLAAVYGDWTAMRQICEPLPLSLGHERLVLDQLIQNPQKTRFALGAIRDQVKMWVHAYGSFLMNDALSKHLETMAVPPTTIPLPLSSKGAPELYRATMERDGTLGYREVFAQFPFLSPGDKFLPTQIHPNGVRVLPIPQGCLVRFTLDKGAYATTCLSHAFRVIEGLPVPPWVMDGRIDGFAELGETSIETILSSFEAEATDRRDAHLSEDENEE
jgi:tRNA(Glu) U13 pseudouridine synthase TruD